MDFKKYLLFCPILSPLKQYFLGGKLIIMAAALLMLLEQKWLVKHVCLLSCNSWTRWLLVSKEGRQSLGLGKKNLMFPREKASSEFSIRTKLIILYYDIIIYNIKKVKVLESLCFIDITLASTSYALIKYFHNLLHFNMGLLKGLRILVHSYFKVSESLFVIWSLWNWDTCLPWTLSVARVQTSHGTCLL